MDTEELLRKLRSLVRVDIDAVPTYEEAIEHVDDPEIRGGLEHIRSNHEEHIRRLSEIIESLGGEKPEREVDLVGRMAEWFTSIRSSSGEEGALRALNLGERYHVFRYNQVKDWDVDPSIRQVLIDFLADEQWHLKYVEGKLHVEAGTR